MHEVWTQEAIEQGVKQLNGKPVVIYANGQRRVIGEVVSAQISSARDGIVFAAKITDEEVAGILGAAQDKNQAAASPLGLSDAEVEAVIGTVGPPFVPETFDDDRWADNGGAV